MRPLAQPNKSFSPPGYYYDLDDSYDESDEEEVRAHLRCVAEQPPLKLDTSSEVLEPGPCCLGLWAGLPVPSSAPASWLPSCCPGQPRPCWDSLQASLLLVAAVWMCSPSGSCSVARCRVGHGTRAART